MSYNILLILSQQILKKKSTQASGLMKLTSFTASWRIFLNEISSPSSTKNVKWWRIWLLLQLLPLSWYALQDQQIYVSLCLDHWFKCQHSKVAKNKLVLLWNSFKPTANLKHLMILSRLHRSHFGNWCSGNIYKIRRGTKSPGERTPW